MFLTKLHAGVIFAGTCLAQVQVLAQPAPQPQPVPVAQPAPAVQPQPAPVAQPQAAPAVQPQPAPAVQPQPVIVTQPQLAPVVQPQPAPAVQSPSAPVAQPQPQPAPVVRPQPQPAPVVQPQPVPVVEPKPAAVYYPKPVSVAAPVAVAPPAAVAAVQPHPDDDTFAMLREAARMNDATRAEAYAARLPQYVIPSYVEYYRLKPRLAMVSPDEIRSFLARHHGSAIADRLRNDWLLELGRARDWTNFDQQYPLFVLNDDLQVRCYALMSRVARGEKVADEARLTLSNPPAYGDACNGLMVALAQSGQFDTNDLLVQLRLAGETSSTGPARRAATLLGASDTRAAQAVDFPALAMARGVGDTRAEREIYLVALGRMARSSLNLAQVALRKNLPLLSAQEQAIGWAVLAHAASLKLDPAAWDYWQLTDAAPLTHEQLQWKTRIALRRSDWRMVRATIDAMPPSLRSQPAWTYWMARAMKADGGHPEASLAMYQRIADQNSFYGQLALEEIGQQISIPPPGPALTPQEIAPMAANPGLRRALKFFSLRMRPEGSREWNWELRKFNERELIAAAEFARRHDILDRMVHTSERTRTQFDYTQRFPSPHIDVLSPTTTQLGLDKAWVYGLIRQESRFIMDARSSAGASGLMQVMPATAQFVARKIGLGDYVKDRLNDLHTNLVLGSNYMNMVLANAGGSQPLATAAYNAGPGRMRAWRATLSEPMEGAVFAESIPYLETRVYVKNVMANATNYAALFEKRPQSLKARLGKIAPNGGQASDFP